MVSDLSAQLGGLPGWVIAVAALAWSALVIVGTPLLFRLLLRLARRTKGHLDDLVLKAARGPAQAILLLVGAGILLEASPLPERIEHYGRATLFALIALSVILFADRLTRLLIGEYIARFP